ncbi:hypothetical protein Pint_25754 [Pistacia integerrima]|uniref:Uncharacterized protein n=1 Tax=Pistacia integerrima TaxID=434235 RepID=A0ACC0YBB6_9ROSI|nr:hypothetical protein Pint_25754 [Pistacia integerrima]
MVGSNVCPTEGAMVICPTEEAKDVCPTEDAIHAFLEYLVDPMLPAKSSMRDTLSQSQQQSVAKQVHAVVLLYNYYHRKQQQHLTFEGFESFCKLAVVMRPALLTHLKLMQRSDDSESNDLEKQISLTEKAVMDACDIAKTLDASKDVPITEGWPISKIVIFLIDARKENCFLQFSSITQGVWSMIEKDVNASSCISEGVMGGKHKAKKIKVTKRPLRGELGADELSFQQLAFSAVKEVTGFNKCDLTILGSNVVYSLSKEKAAARFYMMQSTQPKKDDKIEIPIKDVIDSLQGPLLVRNSHQWMVTPVVEYFHLLPYAGIVSEWFFRGVLCNDLRDQKMGLESINVSSSKIKEEPYKPEICNNQDGSPIDIDGVEFLGSSSDFDTKPQQTDKNGSCTDSFGDCDGSQSMNLDACCLVSPQNEENGKNIDPRVQIDDHQRKLNSCLKTDSNDTAGFNIEARFIHILRQ